MAEKEKVTDGDYIEVPSSSGRGTYKVYALGTDKQYCTCPAWKFKKANGTRSCKHIAYLVAQGVQA